MRATRQLVMTGATSGFGRWALERLIAEQPDWRVAVLARRSPKSDSLAALAPERVTIIDTDLASLASVTAAADAVGSWAGDRGVDVLGLNAGIQALLGDQVSADGLELSFAVNHLAHYLLVERLLPRIPRGGRVVMTASEVHDPEAFCLVGITRAAWQDPMLLADPVRAQDQYSERVDRGEARYCASKLMNLMYVRHLAQTTRDVEVVAFNPSVVPGTDIARDRNVLQILGWKYIMPLLAPVLPGARSIGRSGGDLLWLMTAADLAPLNGGYVNGRTLEPGSAESRDAAKIARVIEVTETLLARHVTGYTPRNVARDAA